jgi:putative transposase
MWTIENFKEVNIRYESSGLCVRDFCLNERITRSRFYYWQKQYRKFFKPDVSVGKSFVGKFKRSEYKEAPGFIPVLLTSGIEPLSESNPKTSVVTTSSDSAYIEICYPNGNVARLRGEKDMELVKTLILLSP